jgi:tetratricopeptide (TPR) repeat protein
MKSSSCALAAVLLSALAAAPQVGHAACTIGLHDLPVTIQENRALIDAKIDGHPTRFIVDSGAFFSTITPGVAAEFKVHQEPVRPGFYMTGLGGDVTPTLAHVDLTLGGMSLHRVEFLVGGSEMGQGSAGLLGQNVLHILDVDYDFAHGMIRIVEPKGCAKADMVYWSTTEPHYMVELVPLSSDSRKTTAYAQINGQRIRVEFDTGANTSYLTLAAAKRLGFDPNAPGVGSGGFSYGIGRRHIRNWIMPISTFALGDEEVKNTHLRVGESGIDNIDMLLGADFFLSHHVYVANSAHRIFFTYNGGPVFDLRGQLTDASAAPVAQATDMPSKPALLSTEPKTADEFARRGEGFASRLELGPAIADLSKAIEMDPKTPDYLFQRGRAYARNRQPFLAMADFDAALKLNPDNVEVLIARARLRLSGRDPSHALSDLDAADRLLAPQADARLELGRLYEAAGSFDAEARQMDAWIKAHPDDAKLSGALNARCWAAGQSGKDLDRALSTCDAALRREPKNASFLDSRGLVRLRRGETDKALADYDAALAISPKSAWSLYGRAIAERRKGMEPQAKADFAASAAIAPKLAEEAKARGIAP